MKDLVSFQYWRVCLLYTQVSKKSISPRTGYTFGVNVITDPSITNPEEILNPVVALPAISIAATVESSPYSNGVPYPLLHALLFYIGHEGINLGYRFNWHFCLKLEIEPGVEREVEVQSSKETVWYPHSIELAEDLFNLGAGGVLDVRRRSRMLIAPGPLVTENPKVFINRFEKEANLTYEKLSSSIIGVLADPKKLLNDCYKLYITEL